MEWIEITEETDFTPLLGVRMLIGWYYDDAEFNWAEVEALGVEKDKVVVEINKTGYDFYKMSHYCIITEPKKLIIE